MITRADLEGKVKNLGHADSSTHAYWFYGIEGFPRLSVVDEYLRRRKTTERVWSVDGKRVRDLDAALAVLNGEKTLEEAMVQDEQEQPKPAPQKARYSIDAQISEVDRELKMRHKVYPRLKFGAGQSFSRKAEADMALEIMEAVLETLKWNRDNRADVLEWVKAGKPKAQKAEAA